MRILVFLLCFYSFHCLGQNNCVDPILEKNGDMIKNVKSDKNYILISIGNQKLYHLLNGIIISTYEISSSEYGIGNNQGSNKTPIGLHRIRKKYGKNTPENGKMIGRIYTGKIAKIYSDLTRSKTDDVTSRILWLEGLEKGKNRGDGIDSFKRYIYIHGTSEEGRIGIPSSHGCIRMKNKDIINLYKKLEVGTLVLILEN